MVAAAAGLTRVFLDSAGQCGAETLRIQRSFWSVHENVERDPVVSRNQPSVTSGGRHWTRTSDLLHVKQVL